MKTTIVLLSLAFLVACNQQNKAVKETLLFKKPYIIQTVSTDSIKYTPVCDYVTPYDPHFIGKYQFSDSVKFKRLSKDSFSWERSHYNISSDGFEIVPDYSSNVFKKYYYDKFYFCYYPVYIINRTPEMKMFIGKDSHGFGIQEAENGIFSWNPIECQMYDFCGNGYFGVKVYPHEYVVLLFPKYAGNYKTNMRVRVVIGDNIYVSQPFEGLINRKQFHLKDSALTSNDCYGATPLKLKDEIEIKYLEEQRTKSD